MSVVFPGTFDGIHYGHLDIIRRASEIFDKVIIAVGNNETKKPIFTIDERVDMIKQNVKQWTNVEVDSFNGMISDFLYRKNINTIIRGVRNTNDFQAIQQVYDILWDTDFYYETIPLLSNVHNRHYSSSVVKGIEIHGGDISRYVPRYVKMKIEEKLSKRYFIGLTGMTGTGKNFISKLILKTAPDNIQTHIIDFDLLNHHIHTQLTDPQYINIRKEIIEMFGNHIHDTRNLSYEYFFISPEELSKTIFSHPDYRRKLDDLSNILYEPMCHYFRDYIRENKMKGIIILNCAYLIEKDLLEMCNGNVILLNSEDKIRKERIIKRDNISEEIFEKRSSCQLSYELRKEITQIDIQNHGCGKIWELDNNHPHGIDELVQKLWGMIQDEFSI